MDAAGTDSWRTAYARAADPEALFPREHLADCLHAEMRRLGSGPGQAGETDIARLRHQAAAWSDRERDRLGRLAMPGPGGRFDPTAMILARRAVLGCAPLTLVSGAWLQWLSAPGVADDSIALSILTLYADDAGVGQPQASRGSAYLALLRARGLSENAVPAACLARDRRIADGAFYLPAMLLTMSRLPHEMRDELVGADLCLRTIGLLPALTAVRELLPTAADWAAIDAGAARRPGQPSGAELCERAVDALLAGGGEARRVEAGFRWAHAALGQWNTELGAELAAARDPAYEMAELLRMRAREGAIYHQGVDIAGRPLAVRLRKARTDPVPLMAALAGSDLVEPGRSDSSVLVTDLISEGGPMFRIFAPHDVAVIRRWIDSLPAPQSPVHDAPIPPPYLSALDVPAAAGGRPTSLREAYHLLTARQDTPSLRHWARDYVRGWLARAQHGMDGAAVPLPRDWPPGGLRPWLADQHDRHNEEFERDKAPLPTREALIDSTLQLAPLTLIDGSWLHGFTDYELASSEVGHALFATYWDELGNGEVRLNHPLIYREVLAEMDIHLPPTASTEFAHWPGFRERSFELPVYWLSIGRFPRTFMPEILGLNLAMEMSGVGGSYRHAHVALKAYGFSTRFVDIHNTIDNVVTGHSAWAADAIDTFMATQAATHATDEIETAWNRIRTGYRSLDPPSTRQARTAGRRATGKGVLARIRPQVAASAR